jgi:hypothetical protein
LAISHSDAVHHDYLSDFQKAPHQYIQAVHEGTKWEEKWDSCHCLPISNLIYGRNFSKEKYLFDLLHAAAAQAIKGMKG